ncbi:MAG TPA: thiamine pyrophosphate-dependent enzyme [Candidatus Acidoferrales bacterium]|nr:thiamine pyrophosphate-dependent enzyme [Candidatus Acidoferrales bacterium]
MTSIRKSASADSKKEIFSLVPASAQHKLFAALQRLSTLNGSRTGAEVAEIAACIALRDSDPVVSASAAQGARFVRHNLLDAESIRTATTAGRFELATGLAVSALAADREHVALACCGFLQPSEDLRRALRVAGDHKLPIIYLVANRFERGKPHHDFRSLHAEFGVPVLTVDGNDPIAVFRVITEAAHNARFRRGATLLDAMLFSSSRLGVQDPLASLEAYMRRHNTWPQN